MNVFAPDIAFDSQKESIHGNGALVKTNTPDTTLGSTSRYVYDANGVPRNIQEQDLATALGLGSVAPFEGGIAVGAYANSLAIGCTAVGYHSRAKVASSTALGDQAQATAYHAIALGKNANASGANSISIGTLANATGANTVVLGDGASSTDPESVVIGDGATTTADSAVAIGWLATADAGAVALGWTASASAAGSVALGEISSASATDAIAIGDSATASGTSSIAIGASSSAGPNDSVAIGHGSATRLANEFVAGSVTAPLSNVWFGQGGSINNQGGSTQGATTIHGEEWGGGSNKAGGDIVLAGGRSTGTGKGGAVRTQTSDSSGSGSGVNALYDRSVIAARKALTNNTTTEIVRFALPVGSALSFKVSLGLSITDGTNVQSYTETTHVASTHDGAGYLATITSVGSTTQLGGGGSALAVTISITQPAADIIAYNVKSNTTVITPSSILCFVNIDVMGETTAVTLV